MGLSTTIIHAMTSLIGYVGQVLSEHPSFERQVDIRLALEMGYDARFRIARQRST